MSLYFCIDLIDSRLNKTTAERLFLTLLKESLNERILANDYSNLSKEIQRVETYINRNRWLRRDNDFHNLLQDLKAIQKDFERFNSPKTLLPADALYDKFQSPHYRITELNQSESYKLGASNGECYGFTMAMVDPTISPYKNKVSTMDLEQRIYDYQKNQSDREKDQALIKRTRLTREYFCPDPKKRAKELYNFAAQNEGKELNITLRFSTQRHSCYLSVQHENEIRYMDSNHGVYLFRDKKEFINFYVAAAQKDKENGLDFHFYSLDELVYDGHHQLAESKTLAGKIRTLLTGTKYQNDELSATLIIQSLHFILGGTMGSLAALLMPALGESAVITEILLAGLGATALSSLANMKGHYGLLGIPHLIQDSWHNFMDGYSEFAPSEQEQIDAENEETLESSTITALLQLENNFSNRPNNLPQPEEQEDPQESELFEAVTDTLQDQQLQEQNAYLRPNFS